MISCIRINTRNILVFSIVFSCNSQKPDFSGDGRLDIQKLEKFKNRTNKNYIISLYSSSSVECLTITKKDDSFNSAYCKTYSGFSDKLVVGYRESKKYLSNYDGFECEIEEINNYNSLGQIKESEKYLSRLTNNKNIHFSLPFELVIYDERGKISEIKNNNIPLHKILIASILIFQRENLDKQGSYKKVEIAKDYDYNFEYKDNKLNLVWDKETKDRPALSRKKLIEIINKVKSGFNIDKNWDDKEWNISFYKNNKNFHIYINDETGNGDVTVQSESDIESVIIRK